MKMKKNNLYLICINPKIFNVMTRFPLFAALAAMSLLFSCNKSTEDENPKANKPLILIQTRTVSVEAQGGACEILYTVENAVSGVSMEASCDADWISDIDCSVENKVTFTVAPNDQAEERTAPVILRYGTETATAQVVQHTDGWSEYDVELEMPKFYRIYYGDYYSPGVGNYWFYLMDQDMVNDVMSPNGNYYRIDLYGELSEDPSAAVVPDGTYELDFASTCASGTFTSNYSYLMTTDEAGRGTAHDYTEAVLTVKNDGENCSFELIATIEGKKHRITYNGPAPFMDDSGSDEPEVDYPQLKENVDLNVVNADAYWVETKEGVSAIDLRFMDMEKDGSGNPVYPGNILDVDLYTVLESDGSIKPGTYTIADSEEEAGPDGTMTPGSVSSIMGMIFFPAGTNVQQYDEDENRLFGPVTSGTLTISGNATSATVDIDFTMVGGYTVKGKYTGPLPVDRLPSDASVPSLRAAKRR